jgi:replication-associated recombination protein RarA
MGENDPKKPPFRFSEQITPGGYRMDEVVSSLQKSVRRRDEREALFWASELDLAGYPGYLWRRLLIMASEDVGLADPQAVLLVNALWQHWEAARKTKHEAELPLFIAHAVCALARAAKSGIILSAVFTFWEGDREKMGMAIPDHAIDGFTARGRRMGRDKQFFIDESGRREGETLENPYLASGNEAWLAAGKPKREQPAAPADQLELG